MRFLTQVSGHFFNIGVISILSVLLSACGGGGGGTVTPTPNQAPVANAGSDQSIVEGAVVNLSAAGSTDADGTVSSFAWIQTSGEGVTIQNADTATPSFSAPLTDSTLTLTFQVTVTDNDSASRDSTTTITVNPNIPPTVDAGADQSLLELSLVSLSGAVSDSDGTIASVIWTQVSGQAVSLVNSTSSIASFTAPLTDSVLTLEFSLTAQDSTNDSSTDNIQITVNPSEIPVVDSGTDIETVEGELVNFDATTSDVDGMITTLAWIQLSGPAVTINGDDSEDPSFTAPVVATVTTLEFELTATDNTSDQSSDSVSVTVNPNKPPDITIHFPCNNCRFFGQTISISGAVTPGSDNTFVSGVDQITNLEVNAGNGSVVAIVQTNGNWIAQNVPVADASGPFTITVTATDAFVESSTEEINLIYQPTFTSFLVGHDPVSPNIIYLFEDNNPRERIFSLDTNLQEFNKIYESPVSTFNIGQIGNIVIDPNGSRLIANEQTADIRAFDLTSSTLSILSGTGAGSGPAFSQPKLMGLDSDDGRLVVYDSGQQRIFLVDLLTGNRTNISDNLGIGTGVAFNDPVAITVESKNDIAYLKESGNTYLAIDLDTGNRTVLPTNGIIVGIVNSMGFDATRSQLVALNTTDQVYSINSMTGDRTLVSNTGASGFTAANARQLTVDALSDRYIVNDFSTNFSSMDTEQLFTIDPVTGDRELIFSDTLGTGATIDSSAVVDIDVQNRIAYIGDESTDNIISVNLNTGNRVLVSGSALGSGAAFITISDIRFDGDNNKIYVVDTGNDSIIRVDVATGNRTIISGGLVGSGPAFDSLSSIELDLDNDQVFVSDQGLDAILSIDLSSGERSIISDAVNSGPDIFTPYGIVLDAANNRLFVCETGDGSSVSTKLIEVDLLTGNRTVISATDVGLGTFLDDIRSIFLIDGSDFSILSGGSRFYRVDMSSGDREILADKDTASGETVINSFDIAYDPSVNSFFTWSTNFEALFMVDVVTGDRVVVSK